MHESSFSNPTIIEAVCEFFLRRICVDRIGLKYINRLPRQKLGEWIGNPDVVPEPILKQTQDFFFRSETAEDQNTRFIMTIADENRENKPSPVILDLDIVSTKALSGDWNSIQIKLNQLHGVIRREFDSMRTTKYTDFLKKISG